MDLRRRGSVERWRRETGGERGRLADARSRRRLCPPEVVAVGCFGLMGWLGLVTWTGAADRQARACAPADVFAQVCAAPLAQKGRLS